MKKVLKRILLLCVVFASSLSLNINAQGDCIQREPGGGIVITCDTGNFGCCHICYQIGMGGTPDCLYTGSGADYCSLGLGSPCDIIW